MHGSISTFPTQTALSFYQQSPQLGLFNGMTNVNVVVGYIWMRESREIGSPVVSLRDGVDNVLWMHELPEPPAQPAIMIPSVPRRSIADCGGPRGNEAKLGLRIVMVYGEAIHTARLAAGITQAKLAERVEITQAALSRYENDLREPDDETVDRIATELGVTAHLLSSASKLMGATAVDAHMRRRATAKATVWRRLEARLNILRLQVRQLARTLDLDSPNSIPRLDPIDYPPVAAARLVAYAMEDAPWSGSRSNFLDGIGRLFCGRDGLPVDAEG